MGTSPSIKLRFINDDEIRTLNAEHAAKHRRCLFSDAERQQMSNQLVDAVVARDQDPGQVLLDLEQECLDTYPEQSFSVVWGPFGVARWQGSEVQDEDSDLIDFDAIDVEAGDVEPDEALTRWLLGTSPGGENIDNEDISTELLHVSPILQTAEANERFAEVGLDTTILDINRIMFPVNEDPKAWLLLSYYRDRIIRLISLRQQQHPQHSGAETSNPWSSLVMPCAMTTMAELTIGGSASHAHLAILNALLATSAFHLLNSSSGLTAEEWMVAGEEYTVRARGHLNACLDGKSKYKEVLMAMLCLANAFMVKGDPDTRLTYLLHAERFIRANGFNKSTLSRKRRTLHHCYAYMRIMAETTRSSSTPSDKGSGGDIDNDNDQFRVSRWTSLSDNIMGMEKDPDTAKRDLHLEVPGHWTSTLFPELYGIAESFLLLLSQVIRLTNERDLAMNQQGKGTLGLKEFTLRAKALEKSIYQLVSSSSAPSPLSPSSSSPSTIDIDSAMVQAMYTALLIFFYRRVHNVDAMLLQREVLTVQDYLTQIQQSQEHAQDSTGGNGQTVALMWPAFVAACEALPPESQGYFAEWFDLLFAKTGLVSVSLAKGVCEFIWARRWEEDGLSWPEVLMNRGVKVLCT